MCDHQRSRDRAILLAAICVCDTIGRKSKSQGRARSRPVRRQIGLHWLHWPKMRDTALFKIIRDSLCLISLLQLTIRNVRPVEARSRTKSIEHILETRPYHWSATKISTRKIALACSHASLKGRFLTHTFFSNHIITFIILDTNNFKYKNIQSYAKL